MQSRLPGAFGSRDRIIVLASDHRYFGVVSGLERPREVLSPLLEHVDALMTDPGVLRNCFPGGVDVPVILRASGCTSTMPVPVPGHMQEPAKWAFEQRTGKPFDQTYQEYRAKIDSGTATARDFEQYRSLDSVVNLPDTIANENLILDAQDVRRESAAAAVVSVYLRTRYQSRTLDNLARLSRQARKINLPVWAWWRSAMRWDISNAIPIF